MITPGGDQRRGSSASVEVDDDAFESPCPREHDPRSAAGQLEDDPLHLRLVLDADGTVGGTRLELTRSLDAPTQIHALRETTDEATLDDACRLMPNVARDLIARALELGRYRPRVNGPR